MAAIVNDRDVLIMGTSPRFTPPSNSGMFVTPSTAIFKTASDGSNPLPSTFSFQATLLNLTGTVAWSWSTGLAPVVTGNSIALDASKMSVANGSITATITVDGKPYTQTVPISKVADGATGTPGVGTPGARGAGHWYAAGSSWSDTLASKACPGGPVVNDVVTISNNSSFVNEKYWDGSAWQQQGIVINGQLIVPLSITTTQIDARGLVIRDANGNPILGVGNTLPLSYAASGTVNADLLPGINNAATTATWGGVSGTGKPADNASSDLMLIGRNASVIGNTATKTGGTNNTFDTDVYSIDSFTGGAYASAVAADVTSMVLFGLNSDPTLDASYTSLDYAIYLDAGTIYVFESNKNVASAGFGSYVATDFFVVQYDGSSVKYFKNNALFYTSQLSASKVAGQSLFFDSSFYTIGSTLKNIRFGPMSSNNWANVGGSNRPADNATVGAPAGTSVAGTLAETVASNAAAGASANAAIPGINSSLSDKLSKTVASALQTQITLSTSGAIAVGNASWSSAGFGGTGVVTSPYGIAGVAGGVPKFYIGTDGNPYFAGTLAAGIVKASNIAVGSPDNLIPDPAFKDLTWWGRVGNAVGAWSDNGQTTGWLGGASLYLAQNSGQSQTYSAPFTLTPGATYLVQCQVGLSSDFNGRLSILWTIPGITNYNMTGMTTGQTWSDGEQVHINNTSAGKFLTLTTTYTVPLSATLARGQIQLRNSHTAGTCELGSFNITRVTDATLLGPGVVQTKHLFLSQGGDISNGQTSYGVGNGFWMEGAGNGHGARMSMGNSATGKQFLCDPTNDVLGLFGAALSNPTVSNQVITDSYTATVSGSAGGSYPNGSSSYGTLTANPSGGRAPYKYSWSLSPYANSGTVTRSMTMTDPTAQSVSFGGAGTNATLDYKVVCVITDANGRTYTMNMEVVANHGTPP